MAQRLDLIIWSDDPISAAGVASQLRGLPEVRVIERLEDGDAQIALFVVERLTKQVECAVRAMRRNGPDRVVVVATDFDDNDLMVAVECGVSGLVRRSAATPSNLSKAVVAAARGDGSLDPDLLGRLLTQMSQLQQHVLAPRGIGPSGFTEREVAVLGLLAEGSDTSEIAGELSYSERTIKNVIHNLTSRLNLRNRAHAVAFALRAGVI